MAHRSEPLRPGAEEHKASCATMPNARSSASPPRLMMSATSRCGRWSSNTSPAHALQATRGGGAGLHHRGRLKLHRPAGAGAAREHGRATAARRTLSGRGRAAWVPKRRDTSASGGRLRLPLDRGRRGRACAAEELALALSAPLRVMQMIEPIARIYDGGEMPLNFPGSTRRSSATRNEPWCKRVGASAPDSKSEGTLFSGQAGRCLDRAL